MVPAERYCPACGAAYFIADSKTCGACGASLKTTVPLDEDETVYPALRLAHHLQANQLFKERYRIVRQVGVGGFGAVYEAEDTRQSRRVAIKEIGLAGLSSQQAIEATGSFNREVQLLSSLRHSGIPRMYEQLTDPENWYLVMDFIEGETLEEMLTRADGGCLPLDQALRIGEQICDVLAYLHSRQPVIIFRDLKPANIMLTPQNKLYLIDFGVARQYKPGKRRDTIAFGSPGYAAPEQYGKAQTTPQADIYSLGALLHQMLSGHDPSLNPFHFQSLFTWNRALPARLEKLVAQMLEMDRDQRPESANEVRQTLQAIAALQQENRQHQAATQQTPTGTPHTPVFSTIGVTTFIYRAHASTVRALTWSPDGSSIASCDDDHLLAVWDAFRPSPPRVILPSHGAAINDLTWSPDGRILAAGSENHAVLLLRLNAHPRRWQMFAASLSFRMRAYEGHKGVVRALAWSPDGQSIASATRKTAHISCGIHIWDTRNTELLGMCQGHTDTVEDVAWSPDGQSIASCSIDHTVRVWNMTNYKARWRWQTKGSIVHTLAWSPDSRYLACGASNGVVYIWDTTHQYQKYAYRGHKGSIRSVSWSPDGQRVASAGFDGTIRIWNAFDGKAAFIYRNHEKGSVTTIAWSPDGQHIASAGHDADVHVWKAT